MWENTNLIVGKPLMAEVFYLWRNRPRLDKYAADCYTFVMKLLIFQKKSNRISWKLELAAFLCLVLALWIFCSFFTKLFLPKRHQLGATWDMYALEERDSVDVLFFGSSLVYCDVVPAVIYEESEIPCYVMAGPAQTLPVTYRYLRESCKTQSPTTVFIECTGLVYGREKNSLKANLTYMPYDMERLIPTVELTSGDTRKGLLFPLYAYHDRWDKLEPEDWQPYEPDPLAGYTILDDVRPVQGFTSREVSEAVWNDPENYARNLEYARKMLDFCRKRDIRAVFYITPTLYRLDEDCQRRIAGDIAAMGGELVDFCEVFDELGLDLGTDFRDKQHLNALGAEKFSRYLGRNMTKWAQPRAKADPDLWRSRAEHFAGLREKAAEKISQTLAKEKENKGGEDS